MNIVSLSNSIIRYSFYALFFLVPLIFTTDNSELFELSKMWLTWGLTTIIATAWITKMIITREFRVQRTPLDIPLMLFLSSQIIATLFSLDMRISIWGYYSRFNGGLLSTISYILLYYALVSNLTIKNVRYILYVSLASAFLVTLWGLPSHFGWDPTCYVVRGTFDISCWTEQFVPTSRIFSTLGQPAWMAAYLSFLLPVVLAFFVKTTLLPAISNPSASLRASKRYAISNIFRGFSPLAICYLLFAILFYIALIFTNTRAGFLAFLIGNACFWAILLYTNFKQTLKLFALTSLLFAVCNFLFGIPIPQLQQFTLGTKVQEFVMQTKSKTQPPKSPQQPQPSQTEQVEQGVANITDSGNIRKNVWQGAIDAWKAHPIFGTGVETFAFAYYRHKPIEQNLTSEWDFLYNKAHNEYLNYLSTTGIYGLGTYLLLIGWFWYLTVKWFLSHGFSLLKGKHEESAIKPDYAYLILGLLAGLITIYVSNFFGFSVVIINLYLFLAPGFIFLLQKRFTSARVQDENISVSALGYVSISILLLICLFALSLLYQFWSADKAYALGYNLNRVGQYQDAYPKLLAAVSKRQHEPVFQDELAYSSAVLAAAYATQNDATNAGQLSQQALTLSDQVIQAHPNNIVFLKNRVRILYELSKINPQYLGTALMAIQKAYELSPNDAKIGYNYGVLLGQTGQVAKGIQILEQMKQIKPDFRDVYFALGLFYRDLATNGGERVVNQEYQKKAEENMQYILKNLKPDDQLVLDQLSSWGTPNN